jgi:phosphopentomutase
MIFGKSIVSQNLGTLKGFSHIAATIADMLGVAYGGAGESQKTKLL